MALLETMFTCIALSSEVFNHIHCNFFIPIGIDAVLLSWIDVEFRSSHCIARVQGHASDCLTDLAVSNK